MKKALPVTIIHGTPQVPMQRQAYANLDVLMELSPERLELMNRGGEARLEETALITLKGVWNNRRLNVESRGVCEKYWDELNAKTKAAHEKNRLALLQQPKTAVIASLPNVTTPAVAKLIRKIEQVKRETSPASRQTGSWRRN